MKHLLAFMFLVGCETGLPESPSPPDLDYNVETLDSEESDACVEGWVCWNPESSQHGEPCTSECMAKGDNTKYCYISTICNKK